MRPGLVLVVVGWPCGGFGLPRLTETIGQRYAFGDATAVPLPHPSGASGWLNDTANRARLGDALAVVRDELARLS